MLRRTYRDKSNSDMIPVWDLPVRLFHWLLVASIIGAAATGFFMQSDWILWHLIFGGVVAALFSARIIWGFWGSHYARFAQFWPNLGKLRQHLKSDHHASDLGHNPLGALMIFAFLATVLALTLTGLLVLGGELKTGPVASFTSYSLGETSRKLHELVAIALVVLIPLHITGVIIETRRSRINLVVSMIHGRKKMEEHSPQDSSIEGRPVAALALLFVFGLTTSAAIWALSLLPLVQPPVANWNSKVADECSACHMLYHPDLLPASQWQSLMSNLSDHFGEDASLDDDTQSEISIWLTSHAADRTDNKPAHLARSADFSSIEHALSKTSNWQHQHASLPEALFNSPVILSKANCEACHGDARSGWFSPFSIKIPSGNNS